MFQNRVPFSVAVLIDQVGLYLGFLLVAYSFYSLLEFPGPKLIRKEIQLQWYRRKLKKLHDRIVLTNKTEAGDRALIEKVHILVNKEEASFTIAVRTAAIRIATEQKSTSLRRRAEASYAKYRS